MFKILEMRYFLLSVAAVICILLFYATSNQYGSDIVDGVRTQSNRIWGPQGQLGPYSVKEAKAHFKNGHSNNFHDIFNSTLGFEQIRMISMPDRTDQRDGFSVAASLTGFEYVQEDGVLGSSVPEKALPYTMNQKDGVVGCWRAHANIWEAMIHNDLQTVLVFEGDAGWDVGLRAQLLELARGTRYVTNEHDKNTFSPYGDDWDMLWIGHCGAGPAPWTDRRYVIPYDPTVTPHGARIAFGKPNMSRWESGENGDNTTRVIFPAFGGTCTQSYAMSLRGARKALYRLSMSPNNMAVDIGLRSICKDKAFGFKCIAPFPTIVGWYRPAGNSSSHSDIQEYSSINEVGLANGLMFSTRVNIERLLKGEKVFQSSFPEVTGEEMDIGEITSAVGYGMTVPIDPRYQHLDNSELQAIPWDTDEGAIE